MKNLRINTPPVTRRSKLKGAGLSVMTSIFPLTLSSENMYVGSANITLIGAEEREDNDTGINICEW